MATRTSAIGSFNNGDIWSEAHIDSLPAGWVGYLPRTADQTGITAEVDLSGVTVTVTLNASRRIRVTGWSSGMTATNVDTVSQLSIYADGAQVAYGRSPTAFASLSYNAPVHVVAVLTPSAGAHTYKLRVARLVGSGTVTVAADTDRATFILVEDIGPA